MFHILAIALCCFGILSGQALADALPPVPPPYGFMEASGVIPALRDQALLGHPKSTRLIGVYLLPDDVAPMMNGGAQQTTIVCRAYVIDEMTSEEEAKALFASLVTSAKSDTSKPMDLDDPATKRVLQGYIDATKEKQGQDISIEGATYLGSIMDTSDAYGTSLVAAMSAQVDGRAVAVPMTGAVVWVRRGRQILELSDFMHFEGAPSLMVTGNLVLDWVKALQASDPQP